jgi:transcriptional antiterminator RfaH
MNSSEAPKHYVLYVQPRTERKVESELNKIGLHAYVPVKRQLRQWKDRKQWVDMVLFNSYVFVETTVKRKNEVFNINFVKKYVQFEGKPASLNEREISLIHGLCQLNQTIEITYERFCKGQEVEIMNGHLIGYRGKIKDEPNGKILRIEIASLGCFAQVALENIHVRAVD